METNNLINGLGVLGKVLLWVMIFGGVAFVGWFVWWYNSFKIRFRVRILTGSKTLVIEDKAKPIKKRGHATKWKLRKRKDFVPIPKPDEIDIGYKGGVFVEAYYTEHGEYIFRKTAPQIKADDPLESRDKEFYANEVTDALKYNKKKWSDVLLQLAPVLAIVLILTMFMVFFADAVQPTIELGNQNRQILERLIVYDQELKEIKTIIVGDETTGDQTPPD